MRLCIESCGVNLILNVWISMVMIGMRRLLKHISKFGLESAMVKQLMAVLIVDQFLLWKDGMHKVSWYIKNGVRLP